MGAALSKGITCRGYSASLQKYWVGYCNKGGGLE